MDQQQQQQVQPGQQQLDQLVPTVRLTAPKGPFDPGRMYATDLERALAKEIKIAALSCPELDPLSDFMYVQYAIVSLVTEESPNNINKDKILDRMKLHQEFRRENNFPYSSCCDKSFQILERLFNDLLPGHYLSFSYYMGECSYELALDAATFSDRILKDPDALSTYFAGNWILMEAQQPDFDAIRQGITYLFDVESYDWKDPNMFNRDVVMKNSSEECLAYPLHVRKMKMLHVGMFGNLCWSMLKKVLPRHITQTVDLHCATPNRRLCELFLVPDVETANSKNLSLIMNALRRRSLNEDWFRLE